MESKEDNAQKETHAVLTMVRVSVEKQHKVFLLHKTADSKRRKNSLKWKTLGGRSPCGKRYQRPFKNCISENCTYPSCDFGHPSECQHDETKSRCKFGEKCVLMHREVDKQPNKKPKTVALKNSKQLGCVFQDVEPPKSNSILRKGTKFLGPKRSMRFPRSTLRHVKIRERRGPSQGVTQRFDPHERGPHAPKFEDRSGDETLKQERCARRVAWEMAKLEVKDKATFHSLSEVWCPPAPSLKKPEERICGGFRCISAHAEQKDLNSPELETRRESRNPTTAFTANVAVLTNEEATNNVRLGFGLVRDSTDPRGDASSYIAWKTLRRSQIVLPQPSPSSPPPSAPKWDRHDAS